MGKANAFSSLSWHALQVTVRHGETATLCSWRHKTSGHSGSVESSPMHQQTSWDTATAVWNFWELMANSFTAPNVTKPNQPKQMPEMTKEPGTTKTTPPSCGPRFTRNQHVHVQTNKIMETHSFFRYTLEKWLSYFLRVHECLVKLSIWTLNKTTNPQKWSSFISAWLCFPRVGQIWVPQKFWMVNATQWQESAVFFWSTT